MRVDQMVACLTLISQRPGASALPTLGPET